jgi:hypothetical protein
MKIHMQLPLPPLAPAAPPKPPPENWAAELSEEELAEVTRRRQLQQRRLAALKGRRPRDEEADQEDESETKTRSSGNRFDFLA